LKTAGNFWRAVINLRLSAGVSKQQAMFDCWITAALDAARAAGRTDVTREVIVAAAKSTMIDAPVYHQGQVVGRWRQPAFDDNQGMWSAGHVPTLQKLGAQATRFDIDTPDQFVALGAHARIPGRSVLLSIDNTDGAGHAVRVLGVSADGRTVHVADPGPGLTKDVLAIDLFQQTFQATVIQW
jgi:hypothetical protein